RLILVDACRCDQPPGTLIRLQWPDGLLRSQRRRSSHALGLGEALSLAETLGWLPPQVIFWGVEISRCDPGEGLTPAVRRALPELERHVLDELGHMEPS
nr:hydrogenase maturation protease [Pirellulaceae bacterium]